MDKHNKPMAVEKKDVLILDDEKVKRESSVDVEGDLEVSNGILMGTK